MSYDTDIKVRPHHLEKNAYLYVRQSTLRQVIENTESTRGSMTLKIGLYLLDGKMSRYR